MKFSKGSRLTGLSIIFMVVAVYMAFTGDTVVACTALILSRLEDYDEI